MKKLPNETYVVAFVTLVAFVAVLAMFPYLSLPSFNLTPITGAVTASSGWSTIVDENFDFWCDGAADMQHTPCYGVDPSGDGTGSMAGPWTLVRRESTCEVKNPEKDGCIKGGGCGFWAPEGSKTGSITIQDGDEDISVNIIKGSGSFKYKCHPCGHGEYVYYVNPTLCTFKLDTKTFASCSALCAESYYGATGEDRDGYCYCSCPEGYAEQELEDSSAWQCVVYEQRNCNNGIQDYDEDGIDCGGPCEYDCDDICLINGEQDENEDGIDCGGPCDECIETCSNGIKDEDEEGVDCGGNCPLCSYSVTISPSSAELYANGREEQEFTVTVKLADTGEAVDNAKFDLHVQELRRRIGDPGDLSTYSITTDSSGQATFTYTSPQSHIYDLPFVESEIRLSVTDRTHTGGEATITLLDPRPKITIEKENANVLQEDGTGMAYIDVLVDDPDSEDGGWVYVVKPRSGKVYTTWMLTPDYWFEVDTSEAILQFNWVPPKGPVELRDYMMTLVQGQRSDWNNLKSNLLGEQDGVQDGLDMLKNLDESIYGEDSPLGQAAGEVKSYYDFGKNLKGNIDELIKDGKRIADSVTKYEAFLNFLSGGVEVLEVTYATKSFIEGKLADPNDSNKLKEWLEGKRDTLIGYGCNSLQTGLRTLADTEREANLESIRVPMHVDVTVTDSDGYKTEEDILLYYTYFYAPSD